MNRKDTIFTNDLYHFPENIAINLLSISSNTTLSITQYAQAMPASDGELLQKILQAVGVVGEQSICVDIDKQPYSLHYFKQQYAPHYVIGFGIKPADVGLQFQLPPYHPIALLGVQFLFADALSVIANDKQKKVILWNCLKAMYKVW